METSAVSVAVTMGTSFDPVTTTTVAVAKKVTLATSGVHCLKTGVHVSAAITSDVTPISTDTDDAAVLSTIPASAAVTRTTLSDSLTRITSPVETTAKLTTGTLSTDSAHTDPCVAKAEAGKDLTATSTTDTSFKSATTETSATTEAVNMETSSGDSTTSHTSSSAIATSVADSRTQVPDNNRESSKSELRAVMDGSCRFDELPPLNKKLIRIFLSSTFADTKEERNALMERVYPKLSEFCRDNYGLEFQVRLSGVERDIHVIFIDKQNDSLHVVHVSSDCRIRQVASIFTHASCISDFTVRRSGRLIVVGGGYKLILLMIQDGGDLANVDYSSETQRALSLVGQVMTSAQSALTEDNHFCHQPSPLPRIASTRN